MRYLLTLLVCTLATTLHVTGQVMVMKGAGNAVLRETQYTSVDGSPYLFDDWRTGAIKEKNGAITDNIMVRYDAYRDEVQFIRDGKKIAVAPELAVEFYLVETDAQTGRHRNLLFKNGFSVEEYPNTAYFNVLYDGHTKYLRKFKINYLEQTVSNYGTNELVKRFVPDESEFLVINGKAVEIKGSRKKILDYFGDKAAAVKKEMKDKNLSLKEDIDLISVLTIYDRLSDL